MTNILELTGSIIPANGAGEGSSGDAAAAAETAFSRTLRSWSTGGHSPFIVSKSSFCAPSRKEAPALGGLGAAGVPEKEKSKVIVDRILRTSQTFTRIRF